MPTFDFQCQDCKHVFEFFRNFGSTEHPGCEKCGSKKTEKLIAAPAIHFKGEGFYKTDSVKKKGEGKKDEKKKGDTKKKEKKTEKKST